MKTVVGKEDPRVAMKAVRSAQAEAGIVLGHEELEAPLFLSGQFALPLGCAIEFGVEGGE